MKDHPRIRGEHLPQTSCIAERQGSSPHTRGAQGGPDLVAGAGRIIPAYAGSTPPHPTAPSSTPDHPRIRGEHRRRPGRDRRRAGSSPHTRGAQQAQQRRFADVGIIPAYAGSTRLIRRVVSAPRDHPRIRGEHRFPQRRGGRGRGSSPHTRGALAHHREGKMCRGIIPAYAGSTLGFVGEGQREEDHPRIRGEHP